MEQITGIARLCWNSRRFWIGVYVGIFMGASAVVWSMTDAIRQNNELLDMCRDQRDDALETGEAWRLNAGQWRAKAKLLGDE